MEYLDALIKRRATGCPRDIAQKLEISERSVYKMIGQMKDMGAPIVYDSYSKTYYYEEQGGLMLKFLTKVELHQVKGEYKPFFLSTEKIFQ
ncbi:hypothetical protein [Candidatus Endomicrobiellum devescovinae]|jgi:predicted DNA-binding transcriptional regulator YafY|uniref:hypothetical protein n=1 Tax=Candidatus Endomicrobiellum devescovinae TaxID=3242322 RepID=UPI0028394FCE|nr:HTH domain-containing protein [Endomicrobium sp.]